MLRIIGIALAVGTLAASGASAQDMPDIVQVEVNPPRLLGGLFGQGCAGLQVDGGQRPAGQE